MKQLKIHFFSVLIGVAAFATMLVLSSQSSIQPTFPSARFQYGPHPRDFVRLVEGTPYTVPAGKLMVITALGGSQQAGSVPVTLQVNGVDVQGVFADCYYITPASMRTLPRFVTATAGDVVTLVGAAAGPDARAWGYLLDRTTGTLGTLRPVLEYQPNPQDVFTITQGTPFIVPTGMVCVVTALGTNSAPGFTVDPRTRLYVNGAAEVEMSSELSDFALSSTSELPPGFVYPPGSIIEVDTISPNFQGRALCYLAAQ